MKPKIILVFMCWIVALTPPAWGAGPNKFQENLNRFIAEALENNPEILEATVEIKAVREVPKQAGSLDDPALMFELMSVPVDTFSFSQEDMTQKQVSLSQRLPFPGKLGLKTEIARKDVEIAESNLEELKLRIAREVKTSYYELCFIMEATDIVRHNQGLLKQFVVIAESKYAVGKGVQQDVLKAQVELSKNMDELIQLAQRRKTEEARLNSLMNRLPQAPISISHGIEKSEFGFTTEDLQKQAENDRPFLKGLKSLVQRAKSSKSLAKREYYPDFDIGFRYGQRESSSMAERPDFVSGFVSVNIPLWYESKQSRKLAQETFKMDMAQETYKKAKNQVFLQIKEGMDELQKGESLLKLIDKGIIPQARQSLESALSGYTVDKVDFLTLLDNQVTLFKWEIQHHRELTDYQKNLAKMEHLVGKTSY
ncbi:MAG: TolC family protein [Nitrospinae bacterium]|nr:TolC family protein [Nitrospinota bacterium]